jgi:hypothetical protein
MEENKENKPEPRVPSDIRIYLGLLIGAAITFVLFWLIVRFAT